MGSEQIGNSVHGTQQYEAEKAKLSSEQSKTGSVDEQFDPATTTINGVTVLDWSDKQIPTLSSVLEDVTDGSINNSFSPDQIESIVDKFKSAKLVVDTVDLVEFQEFKRQVISAFKHLGLDTRKHFTD